MLQPIDQGIIEDIKKKYRKRMVEKILKQLGDDGKGDILAISLLDCVNMVSWSWKHGVTKDCISGAFRKAVFGVHDPVPEPENEDQGQQCAEGRNIFDRMRELFDVEFDDYVHIDQDVETREEDLTEDEIVAKYDSRKETASNENIDEDEDDQGEEV
jgi:hypothetical protein